MLKRNWRTIIIFLTIFLDITAIILSSLLAYKIRDYIPNLHSYSETEIFIYVTFFGLVLLFTSMLLGVYRAALHNKVGRQYALAGKAYVYSALIIFSALSIMQYNYYPRKFTLLFFISLPFIFGIFRTCFNALNGYLQKKGFGLYNVVLAGYDNLGLNIIKRFENFPELGYNIKGIVSSYQGESTTPIEIHGSFVPLFSLNQFEKISKEISIDRVFVPSTRIMSNGYADLLGICRKNKIKLKVLSEESDRLLRLARVYDIAGITIYAPPREKIEQIRNIGKRIFDVTVSFSVLLLLSPFLLITMLAVGIESGFPIIFKQKRAAIEGGKVFEFYKFRSMIKNADELKESLFEFNESNGALFKIRNDPRITKVGKFIRRYSIDELPQLVNVLKGDMSIVGPRPLPLSDFEKAGERREFWESVKDRDRVKPGITGLWQISGRSDLEFKEMMWLDLYYIENQSLLFDLEICFATIPVLLFGRGAY